MDVSNSLLEQSEAAIAKISAEKDSLVKEKEQLQLQLKDALHSSMQEEFFDSSKHMAIQQHELEM
jgi:hypothetical protein